MHGLRRRIFPDHDAGSSLLAVVGVMAVFTIISFVIVGSTMSSVNVTSAARAEVQAQSAAEAGIDSARASLIAGKCPPLTGLTPAFVLKVSYQSGNTTVWNSGCPTPNATSVKIVSTGTASDLGSGANGPGNNRIVEAVYTWIPAAGAAIAGTGPALYSYVGGDFNGSIRPGMAGGPPAVVMVKTGDVLCGVKKKSSSAFLANVVVAAGSLTGQKKKSGQPNDLCQIDGNVWTSAATVLGTGDWISGFVSAGTLTMNDSASIGGNAWSVSAAQGNGTNNIGRGNYLYVGENPKVPAPSSPVVPPWADFRYSDWPGWPVHTITQIQGKKVEPCDLAAQQAAVNAFSGPGILDARACSNGLQLNSNLKLKYDLVVFASNFDLAKSSTITAVNATKLWLVTPDEIVDQKPTCSTTGTGKAKNDQHLQIDSDLGANVTTLGYSPCGISLSGQWQGQLYGSTIDTSDASSFVSVPIGIPNMDLALGTTPGPPTEPSPARLGERVSTRDVKKNE
ncbi:hypothetical protein [Cryobacterium sp. PH31-O1]|uniref:hypothetical protein n=1 Tax=Cryobacterium sp. PH31-O1 TaxID=3046306 RepID=UPI0024BBCB39|nr:hypothetical protein [Cryobacterium sp. PH31-O1]MDJ0337783.1 hypothetical protein [Cryobacterium sp. PH31-O1]